jgi:predicted O-methyltransferase YrrM
LEIGTHQGGSALVIIAALDDIGQGTLSCIDINPSISTEHWQEISHRTALFKGASPDIIPVVAQNAREFFDFVLIDGDHSTEAVTRDIEGVLPYLDYGAYLLFHDAHHQEAAAAISAALAKHADVLTDCGIVSTQRTPDPTPGVYWGGLRLLRFHKG